MVVVCWKIFLDVNREKEKLSSNHLEDKKKEETCISLLNANVDM